MNPNDPAFPCGNGIQPYNTGIPIRLYIAAQIMAAMMSNHGLRLRREAAEKYDRVEDALSVQSLELADALIAEYNKETK